MKISERIRKAALLVTVGATCLSGAGVQTALAADEGYTVIYVAPDGKDSRDGSYEAPLATMAGARDKIRTLKKNGKSSGKGYVVYFREGTYVLEDSVEFDSEDSGTSGEPILYRAYRDEEVNFVGGASLSGDDFKKTTDKKVLSRIIDESARDEIWEIDLKKAGVHKMPERAWKGSYSTAYLDKIIPEFPESNGDYELFVDNEAMEPARWPNDEFSQITGVLESFATRNLTDAEIAEYTSVPEAERKTMRITLGDAERAKKWTDAKDALLFGYFMFDWADATVAIDSVDAGTGVIRTKYPHTYGVNEGARVYIYNLLEELDAPGEYYVDADSGILYIYPPKNLSGADIKLSVMAKPLINLEECKYITFKNLNFAVSRTNVFYGKNCENITIDGSDISLTADIAIDFSAPKAVGVKNCYFKDVNGGVRMQNTGNRERLESGECYVENCEFEDYARLTKTYRSAVTFNNGVGDRVMYNKIHGAEHMAFGVNGNDCLVAFNEVYDVCQNTDDAGAFYVGRETLTRGNKFLYNYIHDIGSNISGSMGVRGVYLDDGFSSYDIAGNVFENIAGDAVFIGSGRDNIVYNNVFVNCSTSITGSRYGSLDGTLTDIDNSDIYKSDTWKESYPELYEMTPEDKNTPAGNIFSGNLIYKSGAPVINSLIESLGVVENNYVTSKDPGFVGAEEGNYLLREDSEVYEKIPGFTAVPFTRMGMYGDRAMDRIKDGLALVINSPYAFVNGEKIMVDENDAVMPRIIDNTTYVPIRFVAENLLGAEVSFEAEKGEALIENGDTHLTININTSEVRLNGEEKELSAPVKVQNGRTLVPLRAVSELLSRYVFWDDCGLVVISGWDEVFNSEKDSELIGYIHDKLTLY